MLLVSIEDMNLFEEHVAFLSLVKIVCYDCLKPTTKRYEVLSVKMSCVSHSNLTENWCNEEKVFTMSVY